VLGATTRAVREEYQTWGGAELPPSRPYILALVPFCMDSHSASAFVHIERGSAAAIIRSLQGEYMTFTFKLQAVAATCAAVAELLTGGVAAQALTEFSTGITPGAQPLAIVAGPDGNVWFTEPGTDQIGRITADGVITEFSSGITPGAQPNRIATGGDGSPRAMGLMPS
jgi:streptogramin lyase